MRVLVTPDYRTLSQTAADLVIQMLRAKRSLKLGLPTGNTPLGMYEELARRYRSEHLDFSQAQTFNLDEFAGLPKHHALSYRSYMQKHLLAHVNLPAANTHIPDGSPGVDGDEESRRYEEAIKLASGIDLLILGVGGNGHIAFNEPGSAFDSRTRVVDLAPETIAKAQPFFGSEEVPSQAITMGIGTILDARRILLLASGTSKADVIERMIRGPVSESFPASALQLHSQVIVLLDEAAKRD